MTSILEVLTQKRENGNYVFPFNTVDGGHISIFKDVAEYAWSFEGKCINKRRAHDDYITCLKVLSEDLFASGSEDNTIKIWTGKTHVKTLMGHTDAINCIDVLENGNLISGSLDKSIKIWNKNFKCIITLTGHTAAIMALIGIGKKIISGSADGTIKIWRKNGKTTTLTDHASIVTCLCKITNTSFASGDITGSIFIWEKEKCISIFSNSCAITCLKMCFNTGNLVSGDQDGFITRWDWCFEMKLQRTKHTEQIESLVLMKDESVLVGYNDIVMYSNGMKTKTLFENAHLSEIKCFDVFEDGTVVSGGNDGMICYWK